MHRVRERKGKAITGSTCIESVSLIAPGGARRPGGGGGGGGGVPLHTQVQKYKMLKK